MAEELVFEERLYIPPGEVQLLTNQVESLKSDHSVEFVISAENDCLKVTVKGRSASDVKFSKINLLEKMYTSENASHDCVFAPAIVQIVSNWTFNERLDLFDALHCLATYIGDKNVGGIVKLSAWKQDDLTATKNHFKLFSNSSKESPKCERHISVTRANSGAEDSFAASDAGTTSCRKTELAPNSAQQMIPHIFHNAWFGNSKPGFVPNGNGDHPNGMNSSDNMGPFLQRHMLPHIVGPDGVKFVPSWHSNYDQHGSGFPDCVDSAKQFAEECAAKLDSYPKCMNVLILGETGVGKSTFINGLINYLKYNSLDDAMSKGPDILIESDFTMYDDELNARKITLAPTVHSHKQKNENFGQGQSSTQDPKEYVFNWGKGKKVKAIRIIDTPGIGDTRGIDQDKMNFDKILSFISQYDELHAICILIKPNTSRLTLAFRFCIDELLVHLHKSASENLLFCFTNTRGTFYKPGDTLPVLSEHLGKLEVQRSINIPLDISKLFSFDNESFRFLCASKTGMKFSHTDKENFAASWTKSVEETHRLFDRIASMPVHKVSETLCLNNTRAMILALTRPLAEIARNQMVNVRLIEDKLKEIEERARQGEDLKGKLFVDQVKIVVEPLPRPRTVCTAGSCVEYSHFEPNSNLPMKTVYKTVCHDRCGVRGVEIEICPNSKLQKCSALIRNIDSCRVCGCPWSTHMHVKYYLKAENIKVQDEAVERSLRNNDNMVDTMNVFIASEKEKIAQMEAEVKTITEYSAEFASFLSLNSIMPYNDSFKEYVEHLIREESSKVAAGGSTSILHKLQNYKSDYAAQVQLLEKSIGNSTGTVRTVEEIDGKLKEISKLRHSGSVLVDVQNVEMLCRRQALESGPRVRIEKGWRSRRAPRLPDIRNLSVSGYFPYFFR